MGDTQSAQRDAKEDAVKDADSGQAQDSEDCNVKDKISGLHGKSDGPLAELNNHLEDEFIDDVCDTDSALVSAREDFSDTFATVDNKEVLLEDVEINDMTDSDPDADEAALNEKEDRMNEINKGFRSFFSNISLKLTLKQGTDEKQDGMASGVALLPNREEVPISLGDTCDVANESTSETCQNNADHHTAQDSADNESTTCPTVTDMTSEDTQENVEHKTAAATQAGQEAAEAILAQADTEGVTSEVEPEGSCPQNSAEEEVLSPIKVFFTTGIFSSLRKKKKQAEEEKTKNKTNDKESVDMDREEQGGTEEIGIDLATDVVCPSAERALVEEKQKTIEGNEEVIRESAPTNNVHGTGENLVNANDELLSSEEKVQFPSSPLQRLLSGSTLKKVSTKQRGRKKSSDSAERVTSHLQSSVESAETTTEESPAVAPEEVKKSEESAWETLKRLLTPKKFQKSSTLSNEEVVLSSKPEEQKPSEGEEIADVNTEESRKRKDSIVSWDSLLCGSGNRKSRKSSSADEQKPRTEGDDNRPGIESRHASDLDSSHETDDNLASSPEQGGSPSDDDGSTWKSLKRLVTPKRKSRDGEETKEHTSDSEIIQDESSFSLKKFLPGRKKRRPLEKAEQVPSDEPEREEHSDEEDSDTPAVIPLSEFDIPETESQVKIQAVIESQTPEAEDHKGQEEVTGQTTEAIVMSDTCTPALPKETKDTETALQNRTSTTLASMEEVDDLTEMVSKLQQLSDIPEEGLIEESIATPASFADDAARDDTIADVIEFTSEAVTAPEPVDITVEDETEMVSAVSQLTDSSKTSGNTTPVPADYEVKETDNLLHQVVESISVTQNEALVSASDQSPEKIAGSVSYHILETSTSKELTILKPNQTSDATLISTGFTVEVFDAIDRVAEAECLSDMTEAISTQCLSEDTTEEFHTAGISVAEELKHINESQLVVYSSSEENKAKTSEVSPQSEDVNVAEISLDDNKNHNEQAHEMAPPGTDSYVEATIQTDNGALPQKNEALEDKYDQIKESRADDEAQVQSDEMVDESETLTLTDACVSINSEEVSVTQADEMLATSEATPTDEIAKGSHLLSGEKMQDVAELSVGDEEQHELLVVKVGVAEFEHVPVSAPVEPEEVIMKADKTNSQLQSCSSVDLEQAEQGVQELESQSMTEDIPEQDSTVPDSSITSTEAEEQMQHTPLKTKMYIKEDVADILQDALYEGGDQTTEVTGKLQTETSVEETDYCEESNVQVLEHKVITEDSPVLKDLTEKHLATGEHEPTEVPQHISVEEDGQIVEVTNELEEVTSIHMTSVNHDVTIIQAVEKQVITEDNAEFQAENALPSSTSEMITEAAAVSEQGLAEKEQIYKPNDPCEEPRQVLVHEDSQLTKVTDELETLTSLFVASVISDVSVQLLENQLITEDIAESKAEEAKRKVKKEAAILTEQGIAEKELGSIENDPCDQPRKVLVLEDGQLTEVTDELKTLQSFHLGTVEKDEMEVSQQIPVENCGFKIIEVTNELEESTSVEVASVNSDVSTFQSLEKQAFTENNLESHAENAFPSPRGEVVKEKAIVTKQGLVEKKLASIENDCDVSQNILVQEDSQLTEVVTEFETLNYLNVASVNSEVGIAGAPEKQVLTEDNAESQAENALPSSTSEVYEQDVANKELSRENDPCDEPRQVLIQEDGQLTEVTDELKTLQSVHLGTLNSEATNVEFHQKQIISEDIVGFNTENASTSIADANEKETATQLEQSLLAKELLTVESVLSEELQHISVTDYIQVADVTKELEPVTSTHEPSVDSNAAIVEVLEKQVVSEDIPEQDEASVSVTDEVENEIGVLIEQALVEKTPTMVYDDPNEIPKQGVVKEDVEVVNESTEFEAPPAVQIAPLISLFSIVEGIEKQVTSQDLVSYAENTNPVITVEDEKATVTQPEQSLLEKELLPVESDLSEEPQQISFTDDVQVAELTKELEASTSVYLTSVESNASIIDVFEKQGVSEDLRSNAVNASTLIPVEDEKETVTQSAQSLLEKELVIVESDLSEEPQHISVTDDVQVAEVTKELDPPAHIHLASMDSNASIVEVLENQVLSGDIPVHDGSSISVTAEVENETGVLTEEALVVKELRTVDYDPNEVSQQSVVKEDDEEVKVSTEFEAPPTLHTAPPISEPRIVEVVVEQVTFEDPGSNAENAKPVITVEEDKETVTQPEECLLAKELVTVESVLSEELQHISVTDYVQVADVTKELEPVTFTQEASVDSNAAIVEVLEKQVVSEDIPEQDGASASVTDEVENETGVLIERTLMEKTPTMVYNDPNEIPKQGVVKEDVEVVNVSTDFEAPPAVHIAPLNSLFSIAEGIEKQVTSQDLVSNAENTNPVITVEDEKATVTQPEQSLLEKELLPVESDLSEEPQQISFTDDVQVAEFTKELEASTSVYLTSVESNASIIDVFEKQGVSEDLRSNAVNASTLIPVEDEKETVTQSAQSLLEKELVIVESDLSEEPQHISVTDDVQLAEVTKELDPPAHIHLASMDSNAGIVEVLENQVLSGDIPVHDGSSISVTAEVENETGVLTEEALVVKEVRTVDYDPNEVSQQSVVKEDDEEVKVSTEFEAPPTLHTAPPISEPRIVEVVVEQVTFEDPGSNAENAKPVITVEEDKETVTQPEECLLAKELVTVESVLSEELQQISVTDYVQVADVTKELEPGAFTQEASVDSNAAIVEVLEKQVVSEDIPEQDGAFASVTDEVENETGVLIEQALMEKTPTMVYEDPYEIPKQGVVKEDVEVVNASAEFEAPPAVQIAPLISLFSIAEGIEKQVTSQDLVSNAENTNPVITVEDEKASVTQPELLPVESDLSEEPQQISFTDDVQVAEFTKELEASTSVYLTSVESSIIDVFEKQGVSEDLRSNAVNASTLIPVEDEKETVTQSAQSLLEKELVIVESDFSEEPQHISVTDDVQFAEVTKELDPPAHIHLASMDSNAGIVEVLENQVLSGDIPVHDGSSISVTAEVENETGVLTEEALVVKELPTVDYDPNEVSQQSVVKEDDEVDKVSTEFEAPPTLHTAPLISESSIVEEVTFEDQREENAKPVITVEEDKETVTQPEQCLLEKKLVTVESDLIEEPQHISVTDVVQITDITKKLEASTSFDAVSVDYNAGNDISEDIQVHDVASASVKAKIENETGLLTEHALVVKKVPNLDVDPNEIPKQSVVKDGEVVKVSTEFEAPSHVQITPLISDSSIVEVIEKQVTAEDLGSNAENANTLITVENEKVTYSEQSLLEKELVTVGSNVKEEPQYILVTDVQVAKVTKELEASTFVDVVSLDSNAGIVEVVSENIPVPNEASVSVTAEVENETGVLIEQAVGGKLSTEFEAPPTVQIAPLILGSSMVEVIEKQVLSEDIPVTDAEKASASTTAEAEKEAALLIVQALVEKVLITVVEDPDEIPRQCAVKNNDDFADIAKLLDGSTEVHIASINSDTRTPQVLEKHVLSEVIPDPDTENALDSITVYIENQVVILTENAVVEKEIQTIEGDPYEVPRYSAVKNNDQPTEVTEDLEAPTAVKMVLINQETTVPFQKVFEKQHVEDYVALVVPEPSHEVVSTAVNDEGDIDKLAEVERNVEMVEDGAAMQDEDGAAMQAFSCGAKYVKTLMHDDANTETPNIREPLFDVMATQEEPQDTVEPVRVLEPYAQEDMIELAEKSKGDAQVKSAEEVGVTDANEAMDIVCKVQNEVENVSTSLATEEEILDKMDNVTAKEVDQQENQTEVSEEGAKEESFLKVEPVSAVQVIVTPPTDEQEATEITQAQKVTENKTDASIERPEPEVLSISEIGNEEETASTHVFATTDNVSIDKPKPDLDETKVELRKESDENVIEEDSSCSPELLAAKETIEAKQEQTYSCHVVTPNNRGIGVAQIIISSEKVQPTIEMEVKEIQATENVASNIQKEVTELQVKEKEDPTIKIEVTELQVLEKVEKNIKMVVTELQLKEKVEPNIQKEVTELGTEQKSEPLKQIQVSEVKVEANVAPKIQMEGTEFPATEKLESTIQMEGTELQVTEEVEQNIEIVLTKIKVTERPEVVDRAIETIDLEETKVEIKKEFDVHFIEDSTFSPQEVAATEIMDSKQEQTHPCEMVTPSEEGEPTIKMEATEIQVTEKVEPNIQKALTEMKDSSAQPERPEVGVQAEEAIEKARTIKMVEVPESLQKRWVSEGSVTRVIEVTGLVKELDSMREMIQAEPVAAQVGTEQVVFLIQTELCSSVVEPLETTPKPLVHIEQTERTVPFSHPVQPEVGVEAAEPVPQGEEELEQDVWLDAEEDIGKQEGAEKTENEPQESLESKLEGSQADDQEEEFLDTTGHAHIEEESSPEEIQALGEIYEIEREGEDFALEDSQIRNLTETSLICKELD